MRCAFAVVLCVFLSSTTVSNGWGSIPSPIKTTAIDEQADDMYDCHPSIHAKRLGIECDMEGDENAFLLTVAVARCRMPDDWEPSWKCKSTNLQEIRKCLAQDTNEVVFATLLEIYYEVFTYCMNKVSADSVHIMSDLANDLNRVTQENKRLQQEQVKLAEQAANDAKETAHFLKNSWIALQQLLTTRQMASRLVRDASGIFTTFQEMDQAMDGGSDASTFSRTKNVKRGSLENELGKLKFELVERAKWKARQRKTIINERTLSTMYLWSVVIFLLSARRGRFTDFLFDLGLFAMLFFISGWLNSIILKLSFRVVVLILYLCVPKAHR